MCGVDVIISLLRFFQNNRKHFNWGVETKSLRTLPSLQAL
jgi:hypothetical protein